MVAVNPREDDQGGEPRIISIDSFRIKEVKSLRSGKIRGEGQKEFLCTIENVEEPKYLTEAQISQYINGPEMLKQFNIKG